MLHRLNFSIDIAAAKTKIWNALWTDQGYSAWAGVFFEGSYIVKHSWEVGGKVHFLGHNENGIYSVIERHISEQFIQFKHISTVVHGIEQPVDKDSKKWSGATELYKIEESAKINTLQVELHVLDEHLEFMNAKFPLALEIIKKNSLNSVIASDRGVKNIRT